jgi:hypothetical protein
MSVQHGLQITDDDGKRDRSKYLGGRSARHAKQWRDGARLLQE